MGHRSFMKFYFRHVVLLLKNIHYACIPPHRHKTLPTLANEKEQ